MEEKDCRMNDRNAIRNRRSVRTFDEKRPLSEETKKEILSYAESIPVPYGLSVEWFMIDNKKEKISVPVITGCDTYIAGKMKKTEHAEEAFGFVFERIVLYCTARGIGTTWIAGTMDRRGFERCVALKEDEVMPCISPLGYPADKMSFRETMMRKGIKADTRLPFGSLFFLEDFDTPLPEDYDQRLSELLQSVRLAPSAVNKQPWRVVIRDGYAHFYERKDKGYDDGWDIQKIDLGIAMSHFALGLENEGKEVTFLDKEPEIEIPAKTFYIASIRY